MSAMEGDVYRGKGMEESGAEVRAERGVEACERAEPCPLCVALFGGPARCT